MEATHSHQSVVEVSDNVDIGTTTLVSRYIGQMAQGCGKPECTEVLCRTGRANQPAQRYRNFNSRSARAIAITICLGDNPLSHICPHYRLPVNGIASVESSNIRLDDSSYIQQHMQALSIRQSGWNSSVPISPSVVAMEQESDIDFMPNSTHLDNPFRVGVREFRRKNYERMNEAYKAAKRSKLLRERYGIGNPVPEETPFLVLYVRRDNLLQDAFDQLWKRQKYELLRPLRVRLRESDGMDIASDYGGVQIEFFNLVCQKLLAPDAQMFVTESDTGLSDFHPGSLQPLYMFELCGLLFALALYNGVQLPVDLSYTFYQHLYPLRLNPQGDPDILIQLRNERPTLARSMDALLEHDVGDLDYSFPLEANGLRLSVRPLGTWTGDRRNLEVIDATSVGYVAHETPSQREPGAGSTLHHEQGEASASVAPAPAASNSTASTQVDVDAFADHWPGWHLVSPTGELPVVTGSNKGRYVRKFASWVLYGCIAPQREAFLTGFVSHEVIHSYHIEECFPSASDLQRHIEGSKHLDVAALRENAVYSDFDGYDQYIDTFWAIVERWPELKQRQLLRFITASDRIPSLGIANVKLAIHRWNGDGNGEALPKSSTCFHILYLPVYESSDLEAKLSLAVEYGAEGFGDA